jgi:hypothetical protein
LDQSKDNSLPVIETHLTSDDVKARLLQLSKKGKLAGFSSSESGALVSVAAHGTPFDSKLLLSHSDQSVSFECKLIPIMPWVFAILLVVTIWPGLPLTDGFLASFQWYERFVASTSIQTWYWYIPLTVLPAPFALRAAINKSRLSAHQSALEAIEKIRSAIT